jgi:hypothetical protein
MGCTTFTASREFFQKKCEYVRLLRQVDRVHVGGVGLVALVTEAFPLRQIGRYADRRDLGDPRGGCSSW